MGTKLWLWEREQVPSALPGTIFVLPCFTKVAGWEVSLFALESAARAERGECSQVQLGDEGYKAEKVQIPMGQCRA